MTLVCYSLGTLHKASFNLHYRFLLVVLVTFSTRSITFIQFVDTLLNYEKKNIRAELMYASIYSIPTSGYIYTVIALFFLIKAIWRLGYFIVFTSVSCSIGRKIGSISDRI